MAKEVKKHPKNIMNKRSKRHFIVRVPLVITHPILYMLVDIIPLYFERDNAFLFLSQLLFFIGFASKQRHLPHSSPHKKGQILLNLSLLFLELV